MIISHSTWKSFILNHHSAEWLDSNLRALSEAFSTTKSHHELMEAALGVDPSIFLIFPKETRQPTIIHHISKVPKNALVANETDEFFCLSGWDTRADAIRIEPNSFFADVQDQEIIIAGSVEENKNRVRKVCLRRLRNCVSKEQFARAPTVPNEVMEIRKCIPLPPSVACILLEMTNKDPHEMGPILARTIFDIENDVNHKYHGVISSVEGKELIDEILTWLFYAERYTSFSLDCRVAFPGSRVDMASKELHKAKLSHENIQGNMETQNRTIAANMDNRGLNNFLESIERHTAAIQEMAESRKDQDAEKAALINDKGFNKLPNDIHSFLLALASNDLENPAESISQTGLDMLKLSQKNSIVALSRLLKKQGKCAVNLSIAQSNEITSINWFAQNNPFVGLSTCRIPPISKLHSSESAMEKTQKLELLQKLEIEKQEVLQTLTDKSLYKPGSMDDVIRNIETIQGTMEIYLGSQCAIVQRIVDFIQSIRQYRLNLEFKAAADENLLTKIQYLFDSRDGGRDASFHIITLVSHDFYQNLY